MNGSSSSFFEDFLKQTTHVIEQLFEENKKLKESFDRLREEVKTIENTVGDCIERNNILLQKLEHGGSE